jgi:hypothetical protein
MLMNFMPRRRAAAIAGALAALTLVALAVVAPITPAQVAPGAGHRAGVHARFVARGTDTVAEPVCHAGVCRLDLTGGTFRATQIGAGAYTGALRLHLADAFANQDGGTCARVDGELTLGAGSSDRIVMALRGDSCQDGAGDLRTSSFTTMTRFEVNVTSGRYAHLHGRGLASFSEDAQDDDVVTLIGRLGG